MIARDEFFVGWAAGLAPGLRRFLLPIAVALVVGLPLLGLALGGAADDPAGIHFAEGPGQPTAADLPVAAQLVGVVLDGPEPLLHVAPDARHPRGRTLLLAGDGKLGPPAGLAALRGRIVAADGFVMRRGTIEMLVLTGMPALRDGAAETPIAEPLGRWRITGEICDGKCASGSMRPGVGLAHRACAALCLEGDVPAVFVATGPVAGHAFLLLADRDGGRPLPAVRNLIGRRVTLEGTVERRGTLLLFRAEAP